ncbi:MAG TPA: hypothetical protein DCX22_00040 [Dehalococcoidia bacterium]|nr:hypothetical protein [Dehalococcoidia bacterium]
MDTLEKLAMKYQAYEETDHSEFRRKARILQSMWREEQGYSIGEHKGNDGIRQLGSRLKMPEAENELLNYLSPTIRQVVREEVIDLKFCKRETASMTASTFSFTQKITPIARMRLNDTANV